MQTSSRSFLFYAWPRFAVRHPWRVVFGGIVAFALLIVLSAVAGGKFSDAFSIPNSESQKAFDLLQQRFPQRAGDSAAVVIKAPAGLNDSAIKAKVQELTASLQALPGVTGVSSLYEDAGSISKDGTIGQVSVQYDKRAIDIDLPTVNALTALQVKESVPGFQVELGGQIPLKGQRPAFGLSEFVGVGAAILILLVAFGSVVAMGLPILTAFLALGSGFVLIILSARFFTMPSFTPEFGAMIGLGVGIDYALLMVTRFREGLAAKMSVDDAVMNASATAGRSVLFAGTTVVIAMLGLWLVGIPFVAYLGTAAAIIVAMAVVVALVILPAILKLIGRRIDRLRIPGIRPVVGESDRGFGYRLSQAIQRRPIIWASVSLALLLAMGIPLLSLRTGSSDAGNDSTKLTTRRAYDLLTEGFGPGYNGSILVALRVDNPDAVAAIQALPAKLSALPDAAGASAPRFNDGHSAATIIVTPGSSPQAPETKTLVQSVRDTVRSATSGTGATGYVGGSTAAFIDIGQTINSRLPFFFAAVIGLSFLLLAAVFRSVLIALKAALMNVLAIGASFGALVAVFQWGWLGGLINVHPGPIESFLPMFMFAVLFGLSMDYEVFLVTRIHEEYLKTGNNAESVSRGLSVTTRLITAAAAIMVAVFLSFAFGDNRTIKEFGIGLATAIFVDATLIRLVLVPALMQLFGDANWWFPSFLDRVVPHFHVEPEMELDPVPVLIDP